MSELNQTVFVCLTSYQYLIAELMAKTINRNTGLKSIIILKYIKGLSVENNEYADYMVIPKSILGKFITAWYAFFPFGWNNKELVFFNDRDPITKNIARWCCKKILVEEGLGVYYPLPGLEPIGNLIIPDKAYIGYPDIYRSTHIAKYPIEKIDYKSLFSSKNIANFIDNLKICISCDVLLLGQASESMPELRTFENLFICEFNNRYPDKKILIKPHPRDYQTEKYITNNNVAIIGEDLSPLPVEILISVMNYSAVFSLFSSGGVTLANICPSKEVIWGFELYDLNVAIPKEELKVFSRYNTNILIPTSFEDMDKLFRI